MLVRRIDDPFSLGAYSPDGKPEGLLEQLLRQISKPPQTRGPTYKVIEVDQKGRLTRCISSSKEKMNQDDLRRSTTNQVTAPPPGSQNAADSGPLSYVGHSRLLGSPLGLAKKQMPQPDHRTNNTPS